MDVDIPSFDPSKYSLEFPFFETKESDNHIEILGRDDVIKKINSIIDGRLNKDKYWPIIISTSRGMGKTFLLKKFGMQRIKDDLKTEIIGDAIATGRILSFDFAKRSDAIQNEDDVYTFFPRLMVFFLCRMFAGTQVDGIRFERIEFKLVNLPSNRRRHPSFEEWLLKVADFETKEMIDEYIRLTNIAFRTACDAPPVFLLDEIQKLCRPTTVESSFNSDGISQMHSQLSLLLTELAGERKPVCICTGTNSGKIISIVERSAILPQVLSLTPLLDEYGEFWEQLTNYSNRCNSQVEMDSDEELINALVCASYRIPRLLFIAHSVWFDLRQRGTVTNLNFYTQQFEQKAIIYYREMVEILNEFTIEEMAHILLACGVHWIVDDEASTVPGTKIPWATLIQKSLVFPYGDGCYIFPFSLVWRAATSTDTLDKIENIEKKCEELVPNLDVKDLYLTYDILCSWGLLKLGVGFETLFASGLAVKYYLRSTSEGRKGYFRFPDIYDIPRSDSPTEYNIMNNYEVDFSQGISLPTQEVFADTTGLGLAVVHNKNIHNAHHDVILPARTSLGMVNIAVQAKASFDLSGEKTIMNQLLVSRKTVDPVQQLFWLYLGENRREKSFDSIAFLNGRGCCNGLTLDFLISFKKLRAENQK